jgi:hypothetical protein
VRVGGGIVALAVALTACSPTARIAGTANDIRTEARALMVLGSSTAQLEVVARAERIDELASHIHEDLPGTEDRTPAWMSTLMWVAGAVVAVAVVILLWQTGLGQAVRVAVGWLPRRKVAQAELAVDMLDPSRPEGDRELVAAMRAQDAEFDAAYRRAAARRKPKT